MRARLGRRVRAGVAMLAIVVLASCDTLSGLARSQQALLSAGYDNATINITEAESPVLHVKYRTDATDVTALGSEYEDIARVMWLRAPLRFDAVTVDSINGPDCAGDCIDRFDREALTSRYGPRDPDLDKDIERDLIDAVLIGMAVMAAAALILVALLIRSRRRAKRTQVPAWQGGQGPAPFGAPPYGPPPPGGQRHEPVPGFAPPPPGYVPPPPASPAGQPWVHQQQGGLPQQWPPATPPPDFAPPAPPPMPTHDIWERLPS